MAKNPIESDFQSSKIAARPFCEKFQNQKNVAYSSEMAKNVSESEFWLSKMAAKLQNRLHIDPLTFKKLPYSDST